jgi:hypothetical protein
MVHGCEAQDGHASRVREERFKIGNENQAGQAKGCEMGTVNKGG